MQERSNKNIKGIDISNWQKGIDLKSLYRKGYRICYIKSTEGTTYQDPCFEENYNKAKAANMKIGIYHFWRGTSSAETQVNNIIKTIGKKAMDCKIAIDVEVTDGKSGKQITDSVLYIAEQLEKRTGHKPCIYCNTNFAKNILDNRLAKYPVWIAEYGVGKPHNNPIWNNWVGFQYSESGTSNINSNLDLDEFTNDIFIENKQESHDVPKQNVPKKEDNKPSNPPPKKEDNKPNNPPPKKDTSSSGGGATNKPSNQPSSKPSGQPSDQREDSNPTKGEEVKPQPQPSDKPKTNENIITLLDSNKNQIYQVENLNDIQTEYFLNEYDEIFKINIEATQDISQIIDKLQYVRANNQFYVVRKQDKIDNRIISECNLDLEDLESIYFEKFANNNASLEDTFSMLLKNSEWTFLGNNSITKNRNIVKFNSNAIEIINKICEIYNINIGFDTINKKVYLIEGKDKGSVSIDDLNIIERKENLNFTTRLIARGANGIIINDNNKNYVENYSYSNKVKVATWKDDSYINGEALLEDAKTRLENICKPHVVYILKSSDNIRDIEIGDRIELNNEHFIVSNINKSSNPNNDIIVITNSLIRLPNKKDKIKEIFDILSTLDISKASINDINTLNKLIDQIKNNENDFAGKLNNSNDDIDKLKNDTLDLKKNQADSVDSLNAKINDLNTNKAEIKDLTSATARISTLETNIVETNKLVANKLEVKDLDSINANIKNLQADNANINNALITKAGIKDLDSINADIKELKTDNANINNALINKLEAKDLNSINANIQSLTTDTANINKVIANKVETKDFTALSGNVDNLTTSVANIDKALVNKLEVKDLDAINANISDLTTKTANIDKALVNKLETKDLDTINASIQTLQADSEKVNKALIEKATIEQLSSAQADIDKLTTDSANINKVLANKIESKDLDTINANIKSLQADSEKVNQVLVNKLEATDLKTINGDIENLKSDTANINKVLANKLEAKDLESVNASIGTLNANTSDIQKALIEKADIKDLKSAQGDIKQLNSDTATINKELANKLEAKDLDAINANIKTLQGDEANINKVLANKLESKDLDTINANIQSLTTDTSNIQSALVNKAEIEDLKAVESSVDKLTTDTADINKALIGKASVDDLSSVQGDIKTLTSDTADINKALIGKANIDDVTAIQGNISTLNSNISNINKALINKLETKDLDAINGTINNLTSDNANINKALENKAEIKDLSAIQGDIKTLTSETANINKALVNKLEAKDLDSINGNIENLKSAEANIDKLLANKLEAKDLDAINGNLQTLTSDNANINKVLATKADIKDLNVVKGNVESLTSDTGVITKLQSEYEEVNKIIATKANITDLNSANANISTLNTKTGNIENLLAGNLTANNIKGSSITGDKIAGNSITTSHIKSGTITANSSIIANGAIQSAQIGDAQITSAKIADSSVGTSKIVDGSISSAKISNAAITNAKIADATIESAKIKSINANTIISGTLDANRVNVTNLRADNIITGSITVQGENLIHNTAFKESNKYWDGMGSTAWSVDTNDKFEGVNSAKISRNNITSDMWAELKSEPIKVTEGQAFVGSAYIKSTGIISNLDYCLFILWGYGDDGTRKDVSNLVTIDKNISSYTRFVVNGVVPNGVTTLRLGFSSRRNGTFNIVKPMLSRGSLASVWKEHNDELISNGAINNDKLANNAVTANKLNLDDLFVSNGAFINKLKAVEIDASKIKTGTISSERLDLTGLVGFNSFDNNTKWMFDIQGNKTYINGGAIYANSITADKININNLFSNTGFISQLKATNIDASQIKSGKISADRLDISGAISIGSLSNDLKNVLLTTDNSGRTYINGGSINTGSITADKINVSNLFSNGNSFMNRLKAMSIDAGQIKTGKISADKLNINGAISFETLANDLRGTFVKDNNNTYINGNSITTGSITVDKLNVNNLFANGSSFMNSLRATTIDASQITSGKISADKLNITGAITVGSLSNDLKRAFVNSDNGSLINGTIISPNSITTDKINVNNLFASGSAFMNSLKAVDINADRITSGKISVDRLDIANKITIGALSKDLKDVFSIDKNNNTYIDGGHIYSNSITSNKINISELFGSSAFIDNIKAINIDASKITSGKISADRLNISGAIGIGEFNDNLKANFTVDSQTNKTYINGGTIATGSITTSKLNVDELFTNGNSFMNKIHAVSIDANQIKSGKISVDRLNISGAINFGTLANDLKGNFISSNGQTFINGGTINTGSITTSKLNVDEIFSNGAFINKLKTVDLDAGKITTGIISSDRLNINGLVQFNSFNNDLKQMFSNVGGKTYINGGAITTNSIKADKIDVDDLFVDGNAFTQNLKAVDLSAEQITTGKISSDRLDITGLVSFEAFDKDTQQMFTVDSNKTYINGGAIYSNSITADKIDARGLEVIDSNNMTTFKVDDDGEVSITGNVQSSNYDEEAKTGYKISKNGDAVFNDAIIRGDVILPNAGITDEYDINQEMGRNLALKTELKSNDNINILGTMPYTVAPFINKKDFNSTYNSIEWKVSNATDNKWLGIGIDTTLDKTTLKAGEIYTISFWYYVFSDTPCEAFSVSLKNHPLNKTALGTGLNLDTKNKWIKAEYTGEISEDCLMDDRSLYFYLDKNGHIKIANIKLERGSKATNWMAAPEDNLNPVRFWAGTDYDNRENAPFRVYQDGSLYSTKGYFEGAFSGEIDVGNIHLTGSNSSQSEFRINSNDESETKVLLSQRDSFINTNLAFGSTKDKQVEIDVENRKMNVTNSTLKIARDGNNGWIEMGANSNSYVPLSIGFEKGQYGDYKHEFAFSGGGLIFNNVGARGNDNYDYYFQKKNGNERVKVDINGSLDVEDNITLGKMKIVKKMDEGNEGIDFIL